MTPWRRRVNYFPHNQSQNTRRTIPLGSLRSIVKSLPTILTPRLQIFSLFSAMKRQPRLVASGSTAPRYSWRLLSLKLVNMASMLLTDISTVITEDPNLPYRMHVDALRLFLKKRFRSRGEDGSPRKWQINRRGCFCGRAWRTQRWESISVPVRDGPLGAICSQKVSWLYGNGWKGEKKSWMSGQQKPRQWFHLAVKSRGRAGHQSALSSPLSMTSTTTSFFQSSAIISSMQYHYKPNHAITHTHTPK